MAEVHPTARNDPHAERVRRYAALIQSRGWLWDEPTPAEVEDERARRWFPRDAEDDD